MSKSIDINELEKGMVLAVPVKNKFGQFIMGADTVLEEKHKKMLKMWGIKTLSVRLENSESGSRERDESSVQDAKEILSKRLKWSPQNKLEKELYEIALRETLEKIF